MYIFYMEELYKNPKTISGLTEFYKKAKQQDKNITLKNVKQFLKNKYTYIIWKNYTKILKQYQV